MEDISQEIADKVFSALLRGLLSLTKLGAKALYGAYVNYRDLDAKMLSKEAVAGDSQAKLALGVQILYEEQNDKDSIKTGLELIEEAARQGNKEAENLLDSLQK